MDVLSDILRTLRLRGTLYFATDFRPPWGVRVPPLGHVSRFHLITRGSCWVRVEGRSDPIPVEAGDIVLVPGGAEHVLTDTPDTPCKTVDDVVRQAGFTGRGALVIGAEDGGAPTRMVCGHFAFDEEFHHPLLSHLPAALIVRWQEEVRDYPLEDAVRFITREVLRGEPGHEAVVARLSEVLFVQIVRTWARRTDHARGVLAALSDPRLGAAVVAMHQEPGARWTLQSLSRRASMGRSAFAEQFRQVVGEPPLRYLTQWRTLVAKRLLTDSGMTIEQIADRVGYESGASFSRVFKKHAGVNPGSYRLQTHAAQTIT